MDAPSRRLVLIAALVLLALTGRALWEGAGGFNTPATGPAGPVFAADVPAPDRAWIVAAMEQAARPEARRLVEAVDRPIEIRRHAADGRTAGFVQPTANGYVLSLDLDTLRALGPKIRDHVVLHELGHVVDHALVPPELNAQLDRGIPRLESCTGDGVQGGCAVEEERFADTFAKWALGDAVGPVSGDISAGYRVPPPGNLVGWAEPLLRVGT